jgi:hypothetical protein
LQEELKHLERHRVLEALAQRLLVSLLQESRGAVRGSVERKARCMAEAPLVLQAAPSMVVCTRDRLERLATGSTNSTTVVDALCGRFHHSPRSDICGRILNCDQDGITKQRWGDLVSSSWGSSWFRFLIVAPLVFLLSLDPTGDVELSGHQGSVLCLVYLRNCIG